MAEPPPPPEFLFGEELDPEKIRLDAQRIVRGLLDKRPSLFDEIRTALSAEPFSFKELLSVDGEMPFLSPMDVEGDGDEDDEDEDEEDDYGGYPTASKYAWAVAEELLNEIASELREEDDSIDELTSDERRELIQMIYEPLMEEIAAL